MANEQDIECHLIVFVRVEGVGCADSVPWDSQEGEPLPTRMHTQGAPLLIVTRTHMCIGYISQSAAEPWGTTSYTIRDSTEARLVLRYRFKNVHTYTYARMHVCTYVCTYVCMNVCIYIYVCLHACSI